MRLKLRSVPRICPANLAKWCLPYAYTICAGKLGRKGCPNEGSDGDMLYPATDFLVMNSQRFVLEVSTPSPPSTCFAATSAHLRSTRRSQASNK